MSSRLITIMRLIVAATLTLILLAALVSVPMYQAYQLEAKWRYRAGRVATILDGLANYDQQFGKLPDAVTTNSSGRALYSWRVSILPFIQSVDESLDLGSPCLRGSPGISRSANQSARFN